MADGGSFLDGARETWKGIRRTPRVLWRLARRLPRLLHHPFPTFWDFCKHVWMVGHDDQRASWFAHWAVCAGVSGFIGGVFALHDLLARSGLDYREGYLAASVGMFLFYAYREAGDTRFHEFVAKDWDKLDEDTDWQGRKREGTSARYDRVGDMMGPTMNLLTTLATGGWA